MGYIYQPIAGFHRQDFLDAKMGEFSAENPTEHGPWWGFPFWGSHHSIAGFRGEWLEHQFENFPLILGINGIIIIPIDELIFFQKGGEKPPTRLTRPRNHRQKETNNDGSDALNSPAPPWS